MKQSVRGIRRYLVQANSDESHVEDILALGVLPRIKELMQSDNGNSLKFECAWIVTNIAAGTTAHTQAIVQAGFIDVLLEIISSKKAEVYLKAQAAWALGNIAGESPAYREELMTKGSSTAIVNVLNDIYEDIYDLALRDGRGRGRLYLLDNDYDVSTESLLWSLSNMARGGYRTADYYENYLIMFDAFAKYVMFENPKQVLEACWGLCRVLYNMHEVGAFYYRVDISVELCERLGELITSSPLKVVHAAIRTIVNISNGPDKHAMNLLQPPVLLSFMQLLTPQTTTDVRKDAYLALSNLVASNEEMIDQIIQHRPIIDNVINHLAVPGHTYTHFNWEPTVSHAFYSRSEEWKVTKEALWVILNLVTVGSDSAIYQLLSQHPTIPATLAALLNYIRLPTDACEKTLECMISLVQRTNKCIGDQYQNGKNPYVRQLIDGRASIALSTIQQSNSTPKIWDLCSKLDKLLYVSEESVSQAAAMVDAGGMASAFGLPSMVEIQSKSQKRRVIRGLDDGDVRLIENAVNNLCI
ncbi:ARM repeat-containing protein [Rhizopus microsporus ATCC 52813]|uniref:ARM repeat-containing protein n=2 Tax=Rhizopus microsporus TaxID=58291 RepID=A0A2G4SJK8_RHIZD|nr:ARM repeat-containing protein [Rhizopus microsporus ATCC 52813]PHZ08960.1 ARM repeat-containing protein [Rhizopus microsporus ATCC 52813]